MIEAATANPARSLGDAVISIVLPMSRPQSDNVDVTLSKAAFHVRGPATYNIIVAIRANRSHCPMSAIGGHAARREECPLLAGKSIFPKQTCCREEIACYQLSGLK